MAGPHDWRYSRKTPGRYNAYGGFRMIRTTPPDVVKHGRILSETDASWLVQLAEDPPGRRRYISRKYAQAHTGTGTEPTMFLIPGWLWVKMTEGQR